jgi:hypothetical protein
VSRKTRELEIIQENAARLTLIVNDEGLHLIKHLLQSSHEHRQSLAWVKLNPHQPRIPQYHQQREWLAPGQAKLSKVYLGL